MHQEYIGKTVLVKEIAYLWATKSLLMDVTVLLLLFLRDHKVHEIESEKQLTQYFSNGLDDSKVNSFAEKLMNSKICIILDGYDEYPASLQEDSFIARLIDGSTFFINGIVVVTSRPTATMHLHNIVDQRIEILARGT